MTAIGDSSHREMKNCTFPEISVSEIKTHQKPIPQFNTAVNEI